MLKWNLLAALGAAGALIVLLPACATDAKSALSEAPGDTAAGAGSGGTSGSTLGCLRDADCGTGLICQNAQCVASDGLATEQKDNAIFQQPQASTHYVFALSPNTSSVAVIDPLTLLIRSIPLPANPVGLAVLPGQDAAVIVEYDGSSVSFISCTDSGCTLQTQPTAHRYPGVTASADGLWAVLWTPDPATPDQGAEGIVGVVDLGQLSAGTAVPIVERATGRRDTNVFFHSVSGAAVDAVVIAEDDVAVLNLATLSQQPLPVEITLPADYASVDARQTVASPDGSWALVGSYASEQVGIIDVAQRQLQFVTLPGTPSDVELTADGQTALAVMRATGQVAYFPLPGALTDPTSIHVVAVALVPDGCATPVDAGPPADGGAAVDAGTCTAYAGQAVLSPDGSKAALFTNATETKSFATLDLSDGTVTVFSALEKWVNTLGIGPDGNTVIVLHTPDLASTASDPYQRMVDQSQGYSVVDLSANAVQLKLTDAVPPLAFVFSSDALHAAVTLSDAESGSFGVDSIDLQTLVTASLALASAPEFAGSFSGSTPLIWITQDDPAGRISFVDLSTNHVSTATGFALNAGISP